MRGGAGAGRWAVVAGVVCAALGAGACAAARGAPEGSGPAEPAGCYQVVWNGDMADLGMPWGFELLNEPVEAAAAAYHARTRTSATTVAGEPFNVWWVRAGDTIRIGYQPAGGSLSIDAAYADGVIDGRARSVGDALELGESPGPRPAVAFRAYRVVCPAAGA